MSMHLSARSLAALNLAMGIVHFVKPEPFDALIPQQLPGSARAWTLGSGVAEIACGTLLLVPATRRIGGWASAALYAGVYPGNLKMAWDSRDSTTTAKAVSLGRLPLQWPLVRSALAVARP